MNLIEMLQDGPLALVEYRNGGEEEEIRWRDDKTGNILTAKVRNYNCELTGDVVRVSLPRDSTAETTMGIDKPLTKGTKYLLRITQVQVQKGVLKMTGTFHLPPPEFSAKVPSAK